MPRNLQIYRKLTTLPLGHFIFNKAVGFLAPFFGKIHPNVIELKPGLCIVQMKDRWSVRNHIGSINAGAMCTLAELTGGLAVDATLPKDLRWIPKKMTVEYLEKAKGVLEATCRIDGNTIQEGDLVLPISVMNMNHKEVFHAEITFYISKKKPK